MANDKADKAKILKPPDLPTVVKGDGRYLMTLLRQFLAQTAREVNIANGFSADDLAKAEQGKVATPKNFYLSFDRLGGVLRWDDVYDVEHLAFYEVRSNKNIGAPAGLLYRGIENTTNKLPLSYTGNIYLYAVNKNGDSSTPAHIAYTKARPTAPTDLALTKDQQGTLITFLAIPLDCLGAKIYINGGLEATVQDNIYLYTDDTPIKKVEVAYYDQFGDGEMAELYVELPDVTGFMVERNGSQLYFYWDALPIHNVRYVVKAGVTPDWNNAVTLFETAINKHRYIYPHVGTVYMLIKAVDEHNNFSADAAYVVLANTLDQHKNVIIELDQQAVAYNGNKVGMYYDAEGGELKVDRDMWRGEYTVKVELPQKFRARNWYDYNIIGETYDGSVWDDMTYEWDSDEANVTIWNGTVGDLGGTTVTQEIACYTGVEQGFSDIIELDNKLTSDNGVAPAEAQKANAYGAGRWHDGLTLNGITRLSYGINMQAVFSLSFILAAKEGLADNLLATITNDSGAFLVLGYDAYTRRFYLRCSDGVTLYTDEFIAIRTRDWFTFAISQDEHRRDLFVYSMQYNKCLHAAVAADPLGEMKHMYFYPKF